MDVGILAGKTLTDVKYDDTQIIFTCSDGTKYQMLHFQDCCETVRLEDICGNLEDLIGSPIIEAEEVSGEGEPQDADSYTWTFYKIGTRHVSVTLRWLGVSNGYYSEKVHFQEITNAHYLC